MWKNPFNTESDEGQEELDIMAESARRQIEDLTKKEEPEEPQDQAGSSILDFGALQNLNNNLQQQVQSKVVFSNATFTSNASIGVGGGGAVAWQYDSTGIAGGNMMSGMNNPHHDQGVCQESYDKGYEDGKAGAQSDETRA